MTISLLPGLRRSGLLGSRLRSTRLLLPSIVFALSGCGLVSSDIDPESIEVRLEGPAGAQVRLVTSNSFTFGGGGEDGGAQVELVAADTTLVSLDHALNEALAPTYLYYAELLPNSPGEPLFSVRMQVRIDGDLRYDKSGQIGADEFEYAYVYR